MNSFDGLVIKWAFSRNRQESDKAFFRIKNMLECGKLDKQRENIAKAIIETMDIIYNNREKSL